MSLLHSFRDASAAFPQAREGQVAIMFALSAIPMIMFIGTAVDYSRALTAQTNLQQATDATALAMIQTAAGLTNAALVTQANNYLSSASQDPNAVISQTAPLYSSTTGKLCINTASSVPTTFTRVMSSLTTMNIQASSCAALGGGTFEVAMVLDNTGSMSTVDSVTGKSKIQNEVLAAENLVTTVFNGATTSPNYQISIVPFTTSVNVGTQYSAAAWVDTNAGSSIAWENVPLATASQIASKKPKWTPASRFTLFSQVGVNWGGCLEERPQPYTLTDTAPSIVYPNTLFEPMFAPDEGDNDNGAQNNYLSDTGGECSTTPDSTYSTANDNAYHDDVSTLKTGDGQGKYCKYKAQTANTRSAAGPNWGCDSTLPPIQLLTNSQNTLTTLLNKMQANGNTNLVSGFLWGWRTISPNGPFENGGNIKPYHYTSPTGIPNNKFIVFMTDGFNNWQPESDNNGGVYSSFGYYANDRAGMLPVTINGVTTNSYPNANNQRQYLDAAFLQSCSNAKAAGVQVYTIGFSIPNDPIDQEGITVLQQCASQASMAYVATNGNQIVNIFGAIGTQLGQVRLTN